jgi:flagellar motor switch protein FliG
VASLGIRKAALMLMGLDPPTAAELLKAARPEMVTQIAAELAYLEARGESKREASHEPIREFFRHVKGSAGGGQGQRFLQQMLEGVLGQEKSSEIMGKIPTLVDQRDPFLAIRAAEPQEIADALAGEPAQVASLVLSELPPKASARLLPLLSEKVREEAVRGMTREETVAPETRLRVASVVRKRLTKTDAAAAAPGAAASKADRQKQLRKVAVLLRDLGGELRAALIQAIAKADEATSVEVQKLMVMWEDILIVSDRSVQEALRGVDSRKLALALVDGDPAIVEKLRKNMSERLVSALDEESSLLAKPKKEDVELARVEFLDALRELAANNFLTFEET